MAVALVDELHHGRDRGVEGEAARHVLGDLVDRPVRLAHQVQVGAVRVVERAQRLLLARLLGDVRAEAPQAAEEAVHALDALVGPVRVVVGRPDEEDVAAGRVRAVALDVRHRADHVALRLGHLRAVARDHPLREEGLDRLLGLQQVHVRERLHEEARVHQVQDRVLDAADVLVDRHPVVGDGRVERRLVVVRVRVAQEVPRRVDEGVHRVGLAPRGAAAARARRRSPSPRPTPAASAPWARSPRSRAAGPAGPPPAPGPGRRSGSGRSGSGSPSSAGGRAASRAAGS